MFLAKNPNFNRKKCQQIVKKFIRLTFHQGNLAVGNFEHNLWLWRTEGVPLRWSGVASTAVDLPSPSWRSSSLILPTQWHAQIARGVYTGQWLWRHTRAKTTFELSRDCELETPQWRKERKEPGIRTRTPPPAYSFSQQQTPSGKYIRFRLTRP